MAAITLLVAACGDDGDSSAAASTTTSKASTSTVPATTAATTVPRTTAPITTSVVTTLATSGADTTTTSAVSCSESPPFDPNGSLRDQFVTYLVSCGFTQSEAACLFEHLDFDDPAVLAGDPDAMLPAYDACSIDIDRMAEIGAP